LADNQDFGVKENNSLQSHPLSEAIYEGVLETPPWHGLLRLLEDICQQKVLLW
jgi:hypothetical protein